MARQTLRTARANSAQLAPYIGPAGEPITNTDTGLPHWQDGQTPGGIPLAPSRSPRFTGISKFGPLELSATNDYNDAGNARTLAQFVVGTDASPTTDKSAVTIVQKTSNYNTPGLNTTGYYSHVKRSTGSGATAAALYGETIDYTGGSQASIIGVGGHAQLNAGADGSAVGVSAYATITSGVTSFQHGCGIEVAIENLHSDAPVTLNIGRTTSAVLAGNTGSKISDAAFLTNPYTAKPFRNGVMISENSIAADGAAFRSRATCAYGLDTAQGTHGAAVRMGNNVPLVARNRDNNGDADLLRLDASNVAVLGTGAESISLPVSAKFGGALRQGHAFTAGPTLDAREQPATVVANGAKVALGGGAVGGLFLVENVTTNAAGAYFGDVGAAGTPFVLISSTGEFVAPTTTPGAGKSSLAFDGTAICVFNGTGANANYRVLALPIR